MMYSFAQREDTKVVDEPFYGYYLAKTGIKHPGFAETISSMSRDPSEIIDQIHSLEKQHPVIFLKNMAHHHVEIELNYLKEFKNIFLIRNPKQLIASFAQVIHNPTIQDIGLKDEADLFKYCQANGKYAPIVIDSNDLLSNPEEYISTLCQKLEIPYSPAMLTWKKGAISEDGIWAEHWYKNIHNSTGFAKQKTSSRPFDNQYQPLLETATKYYDELSLHKII